MHYVSNALCLHHVLKACFYQFEKQWWADGTAGWGLCWHLAPTGRQGQCVWLRPVSSKPSDKDKVRIQSPLTFLWPGVIFSEGMVFINIWIQILQGVLWNVFGGHDFVIANNIRESNGRKFFLCVRFNRMEVRFWKEEKWSECHGISQNNRGEKRNTAVYGFERTWLRTNHNLGATMQYGFVCKLMKIFS